MSSSHWSKGDLLAKRYVYFWVDVPSLNASVTDAGTNRWSPATAFKIFENIGGRLRCCGMSTQPENAGAERTEQMKARKSRLPELNEPAERHIAVRLLRERT